MLPPELLKSRGLRTFLQSRLDLIRLLIYLLVKVLSSPVVRFRNVLVAIEEILHHDPFDVVDLWVRIPALLFEIVLVQ